MRRWSRLRRRGRDLRRTRAPSQLDQGARSVGQSSALPALVDHARGPVHEPGTPCRAGCELDDQLDAWRVVALSDQHGCRSDIDPPFWRSVCFSRARAREASVNALARDRRIARRDRGAAPPPVRPARRTALQARRLEPDERPEVLGRHQQLAGITLRPGLVAAPRSDQRGSRTRGARARTRSARAGGIRHAGRAPRSPGAGRFGPAGRGRAASRGIRSVACLAKPDGAENRSRGPNHYRLPDRHAAFLIAAAPRRRLARMTSRYRPPFRRTCRQATIASPRAGRGMWPLAQPCPRATRRREVRPVATSVNGAARMEADPL
jgi:hypothetical protein